MLPRFQAQNGIVCTRVRIRIPGWKLEPLHVDVSFVVDSTNNPDAEKVVFVAARTEICSSHHWNWKSTIDLHTSTSCIVYI